MTTALERPVRELWRELPYHGFTACASCREPRYSCGLNVDSRICAECFEFVFGCVAPNMRRRNREEGGDASLSPGEER